VHVASVPLRTSEIIDDVLAIWGVPEGHRAPTPEVDDRPRRKSDLVDLLTAGVLEPGARLYPRPKKFASTLATVLPNGSIEVDGIAYTAPSGAVRAVTGSFSNGWSFWLVDPATRRSLGSVWRQYVEQRSVAVDDDDEALDEDDDEALDDDDEALADEGSSEDRDAD
jgi:hypothetical protein